MINSRFRAVKYSFLLLFIAIPATSVAQPSKFDVFPLGLGLHFQYEYMNRYRFQEFLYQQNIVDSGLVDYLVLGVSIPNDTTRNWSIRQRSTLLHHSWGNSLPTEYDTSYWVSDSTTFQVQESLNGMHKLSCASKIWNVPISGSSQMIFRYADSSSLLVGTYSGTSYPVGNYDSLWFSSGMGLTYSIQASWRHGNTHTEYLTWARLLDTPTAVHEAIAPLPARASLSQNYPNPFNPVTTIEYYLPTMDEVHLFLYDNVGRESRMLDQGIKSQGFHRVVLDAKTLSSGVYFYRLTTSSNSITQKLVLIR